MRLAGVAAVLLFALTVPVASASTPLPTLLGDAAHSRLTWQVRPASILYTGDSTGILGGFDGTGIAHPGHLKWSSWTPNRASATGAVWIDDCKPSCASGTFTAHTVKVSAFRPRHGHFTRLTLRYGPHVQRWAIGRIGSAWSYHLAGHQW